MSGFLTAVLAMGVILGFMILIHEFGHYAVAKLLGVRVEQFAIGFGKRLVGFRKGDTDYRINALPLGGYVKMSGESPMDERSGDPGEFMSHPRWHRFLIAIAGPAMNILFAVGLLTCVYTVHYEYPSFFDEPAVIGWVVQDTPAGKAGIQVGDRIVRIDGIENPTWEQVIPREALNPNQPLNITFEREGHTFEKTIVPEALGPNQMGSAGWEPKQPSFPVTVLEPGMPAEKAGIKLGDVIVSVDGQEIRALGTSFIVRHDDTQGLSVTLVEGRVSVAPIARIDEASPQAPQILTPGQRLLIARNHAPALDRPELTRITAWERGRVEFEDTPLGDAAKEMNRYSKTHVAVADAEVAQLRIGGVFRAGDSDEFVRIVTAAFGLRAERSGNNIVLAPRAAPSSVPADP